MAFKVGPRLCALIATVGTVLFVRAQAQPETPKRLPIEVELVASGRGEFADGESRSVASSSLELTTSEFRRMFLRGYAKTCGFSAARQLDAADNSHDVEWIIEARLVSATESRVSVDLRWRREVVRTSSGFAENEPLEESRRAVLHHADPEPLDLLRASNGECRRLVVTLGFKVNQHPTVTESALRYDIWLVHQDVSGRQRIDRLLATGLQDSSIDYVFQPIVGEPQSPEASSEPAKPIHTEISGKIRGRARPDGLIDLTLETWRIMYERGTRRVGQPWSAVYQVHGEGFVMTDTRGLLGNGGVKQLTVRPGETVEVALPAAFGQLGSVDIGNLFAGQSTALRITTTRIR